MNTSLAKLRALAVAYAFPKATRLERAIARMRYVQADPIRAPARAQDLILAQRVTDYRVGDLDRQYVRLGLEEGYLYAYGFLTPEAERLLHPRPPLRLSRLERAIIDFARERESMHPRDLDEAFGDARRVNAWGGWSKATTRALDRLHHHGHLRVSSRAQGIRVYAWREHIKEASAAEHLARHRALTLLMATILAPVRESTLLKIMRSPSRGMNAMAARRKIIDGLLIDDELQALVVDGVRYLLPTARRAAADAPQRVRFLAPFDPLTWDRERFEQIWGWPYRFEAYVPEAKRQLGYYALPLVFGDDVIGWVNASVSASVLKLRGGLVRTPRAPKRFAQAFEEEAERLLQFLVPRENAAVGPQRLDMRIPALA